MPHRVKCRVDGCDNLVRERECATGLCRTHYTEQRNRIVAAPHQTPAEQVQADRDKTRRLNELTIVRRKYEEALDTIARQERELEALGVLKSQVETFVIEPRYGHGTSEGTVVAVASDWHIEERVDPARVNSLNTYNLDIAHARVTRLFQSLLRLVRLLQQDIKVEVLVLAMLGDYITNDIHDELLDITALRPTEAIVMAQNLIISGIEFLLNNSTLKLVLDCHSGNHGRTTRQTHFSSENGHSLEWLMFLHLQAYFRNEPRVTFQVAEGYHSYMDVYGQTIRLHHGHAIKYGGGVGGIFIPGYKAISQWNKARKADLDVFAHFHQTKDGGNFLCNGSVIGYNSYALSIKADYEPPRQTLFLMDKKRGRTCTWPILVE